MAAISIIVIEDSEDDFLLLERRLRGEDFTAELHRVETSEALAAALQQVRPEVVISDLNVPGMSAERSIALVAEHMPDVPVVFISGAVSEEDLVALMRAGASDILLKSRLARLVPVIRRELLEYEDRRARRRAEERLNIAVENIQQGLVMFDEQERIIAANGRFAAIYGLAHEQVTPGTTLAEFVEIRGRMGIGPAEQRDVPVGRAPEVAAGGTETFIYELTDGRVVARSRRPLPDGGWVSTHEDITELRRIEKQIAYMADHDALTDLPNRSLLTRRIERVLPQARRGKGFAILFLDLDRFKNVNDALGHAAGDDLLKQVAAKLRKSLREQDTVARLGGDEFAVLQVSENQPRDSTALAKRICELLKGTFEINGHQVAIDTSIGVALAPADGTDAATLLRCADMALYRAKAEGRGMWRYFEAQMDLRMQARRRTEIELREALNAGHLSLYYQPLIHLSDERLGGFEALLRWNHPERGVVAPGEFIEVAEESGLILQIGDWVLRNAAMQATTWPEELRVAVNLSPVQFRTSDLVRSVADALELSGLEPKRLELEITEAVLLRQTEATLEMLRRLRGLGVGIVMDDFGSGYSSLGYLREFPFDRIKIDRSFVMDMPDTERSGAIVRAVASLGAALGMPTTAEGIETADQLEIVRNAGYSLGQGYIFSPPRPADELSGIYFEEPSPETAHKHMVVRKSPVQRMPPGGGHAAGLAASRARKIG